MQARCPGAGPGTPREDGSKVTKEETDRELSELPRQHGPLGKPGL